MELKVPLTLNSTYNLVICSNCSIGLPYEWISGHLKQNHGIKISVEDVMEFLEVMNQTMTITEAKDWLTDTWTIPSFIPEIPLSDG